MTERANLSGPERTKGRIVLRYSGVQVRDARSHLYVEFTGEPKPGVRTALHAAGFRKHPDKDLYSHATNVGRIFQVQSILNAAYGSGE